MNIAMQTQMTGTATMTEQGIGKAETAGGAEFLTQTHLNRYLAGREEYARSVERRYVEKRGGAVRADVAFGVYCAAARAWEVAQERTAPTPEDRYLAGLARLDAALRALCPRCGGRVEHVKDFGADFISCTDDNCYWCERVEAAPVGLLVDRRA